MSSWRLYHGEASAVLTAEIPTASVDMVYSDPPFGNGHEWAGKAGSFSDRWTWDEVAKTRWAVLCGAGDAVGPILSAIAPKPSDRAYLAAIGVMLIEARRCLKPTGTLWLHFDDTMGAQLRVLLDLIFGAEHAMGLIIWKRSSHHNRAKAFGRVHDTIAVYGRTRVARWRLARCKSDLTHGDPMERVSVDALILDEGLNVRAKERVGYPTQKPVSLLRRFICAATLPGDTVLDPTAGSGTTLVAATELGRRAVGIDLSEQAISVAEKRLLAADTGAAAEAAKPFQHDLFEGLAA